MCVCGGSVGGGGGKEECGGCVVITEREGEV